MFHATGVFQSDEFGSVVFLAEGCPVHRSLVSPPWWRFPDMARDDLQVGATWTDPGWKGRGLATAALIAACGAWNGRYRRMWYIVEQDNTASIRVAEKSGFKLAGVGDRTRPLGVSLLGQYRLCQRSDSQGNAT
ncbi:MAG TPA: GNAT family protein [Acidobacteriaceae bacterium]|nr:GNAT family protein [Acidobacteriaceae bacterium]